MITKKHLLARIQELEYKFDRPITGIDAVYKQIKILQDEKISIQDTLVQSGILNEVKEVSVQTDMTTSRSVFFEDNTHPYGGYYRNEVKKYAVAKPIKKGK